LVGALLTDKAPQLTALDLGNNGLGSAGGRLLGRLVAGSRWLRSLGLWGSEIGPGGARHLCHALGGAPLVELVELDLGGENRLGGRGKAALADAVAAVNAGREGLRGERVVAEGARPGGAREHVREAAGGGAAAAAAGGGRGGREPLRLGLFETPPVEEDGWQRRHFQLD
jgi:hypothetical protein